MLIPFFFGHWTVQTMHWILLKTSFTDAAKKCATKFISTMLRNYGQVRADIPSPHFRRDALIAYGREAISLIKWGADELDDSMKQKAFDSGLAYLRAAGESVDTMDVSIFDSDSVIITPYESLYEKARAILAAQWFLSHSRTWFRSTVALHFNLDADNRRERGHK